jgi:hypothetical protein
MNLNPLKANMTELTIGNTTVLFSYRTPVAMIDGRGGVYRTSKHWSTTTSRHINTWLNLVSGIKAREMGQEFFDNLVK